MLATHTLVRDTEHRDHYSNISSIYGITGGNELLKKYIHTGQSQRRSLPPIKLPYNQNSGSVKSEHKTKRKKKKGSYTNANAKQHHFQQVFHIHQPVTILFIIQLVIQAILL
eukprot:414814_1